MRLDELKAGDRVRTTRGSIAEILAESEDAQWIRVRYLESAEERLVGTEDLCEAAEIESLVDFDGRRTR